MSQPAGERTKLDFYDFLFRSLALVCLTLTVPVLPGWFHFTAGRQLAVGGLCALGIMAGWLACRRPDWLVDRPGEGTDVFDCVMVLCSWFFALEAFHSARRWWRAGQFTLHKLAIVSALATVVLLCFRCFVERRGWQRNIGTCLLLGATGLLVGTWQLLTGSPSPRHADLSLPREEALNSLYVGILFLVAGLIAQVVVMRTEPRGRVER